MDSSQNKTIKFKLMIMKSPPVQSITFKSDDIDALSNNNNRLVGGRQSAKNFKVDLKRYTMIDVFG